MTSKTTRAGFLASVLRYSDQPGSWIAFTGEEGAAVRLENSSLLRVRLPGGRELAASLDHLSICGEGVPLVGDVPELRQIRARMHLEDTLHFLRQPTYDPETRRNIPPPESINPRKCVPDGGPIAPTIDECLRDIGVRDLGRRETITAADLAAALAEPPPTRQRIEVAEGVAVVQGANESSEVFRERADELATALKAAGAGPPIGLAPVSPGLWVTTADAAMLIYQRGEPLDVERDPGRVKFIPGRVPLRDGDAGPVIGHADIDEHGIARAVVSAAAAEIFRNRIKPGAGYGLDPQPLDGGPAVIFRAWDRNGPACVVTARDEDFGAYETSSGLSINADDGGRLDDMVLTATGGLVPEAMAGQYDEIVAAGVDIDDPVRAAQAERDKALEHLAAMHTRAQATTRLLERSRRYLSDLISRGDMRESDILKLVAAIDEQIGGAA